MGEHPIKGDERSDETVEAAPRRTGGSADASSALTETHEPTPPPHPAGMPKRIGQYSIKRAIASGGMGTVYEALQEKPRRTVAVKVMRQGIASRSALRRFDYEAQLLARLRHPGIAQVYNAGTHRDGDVTVPYFAMEYIVGAKTLTEYAKEKELGTRDRLRLFAQVCSAVQHGHQKGIIHRDLKPSNILVDSSGQVKIIDFGVARSTDSDMAVTTLQTDVGQLIGTLQYMSPEQCAADPHDIDTRSDVYALGVLLYELLCDRVPYDLRGAAIHEATRLICEHAPTKLNSYNKSLRGDVETIVFKAMEKDRDRRYESASALEADIDRYLSNQPIAARPASAMYQFRKLVARHKVAFAFLGAIFILITAFGVAMGVMYRRADQLRQEAVAAKDAEQEQRLLAERTAGELQQVAGFQSDMLSQINPAQAGEELSADVLAKLADALAKKSESEAERAEQLAEFESYWSMLNATDAARELIDRTILAPAVTTIDERFQDQPLVDAQLRQSLANLYQQLGLYSAAMPLQSRALELRRRLLGDDDPQTLESIDHMAQLLDAQSKFDEALVLYQEVLERRRRVLGEDDPLTRGSVTNLGLLLQSQGKLSEAEPYFRDALEGDRRVHGNKHKDTVTSLNNMGLLLHRQGRLEEAEPYYREALDGYRSLFGDDDPRTLVAVTNMGMFLRERGDVDSAETYLRQALEGYRRALGDEHPRTLRAISNLAFLYEQAGRFEEAEPYCRQALDAKRRVLGNDHHDTLISVSNMAKLLVEVGKREEAERLAREAVTRGKATLGDSHWFVGNFLGKHGLALASIGRRPEAEKALLEAHANLVAALGENHEQVRRIVQYLTDLYQSWHAAEPGKGYDAKAEEWRAKLPSEQPTAP